MRHVRSGGHTTGVSLTTQADQNWKIVGVGDFDADGKSDILWRNSATGQNYLYNSGNAATGVLLDTQADLLLGAAGADTMTGGPGADLFRYLAAAEGGDSITDFVAGVDKIQLVSAGFANLAVGALNAANFVSGAAPVVSSASAQFLYTTTTGLLRFDADGTGAAAAVSLVTLVGNPVLTAADLVLA